MRLCGQAARRNDRGVTAPQSGEIEVEDQLERRIRKPVDLVRCVLACIEIVVLAVAGVAASATTAGVETDIVDASRRLPHALLVVAPPLALFGLLILPVAMAVQWLVRRQFRRPGPPVRIRQSRTLRRRRPAAFSQPWHLLTRMPSACDNMRLPESNRPERNGTSPGGGDLHSAIRCVARRCRHARAARQVRRRGALLGVMHLSPGQAVRHRRLRTR